MSGTTRDIAVTITGVDKFSPVFQRFDQRVARLNRMGDSFGSMFDRFNTRLAELREPSERLRQRFTRFGEVSGITRLSNSMRELGRSSLDVFRSLDRIVPVMGLITGTTSIAGMSAMIGKWSRWGETINKNAARLGLPVEKLSDLQTAARLGGSSADAINNSLGGLQNTLAGAAYRGENIPFFNSLRIGFRDASGRAREVLPVLMDVANYIKRLNDAGGAPSTQLRILSQLGIDASMLQLLQQGSAGIERLMVEARKLNPVTSEGATAADQLANSLQKLQIAGWSLIDSVLSKIADPVRNIVDRFKDWTVENRAFIATGIVKFLADVGTRLSNIDGDAVAANLAKVRDRFIEIGGAIARIVRFFEENSSLIYVLGGAAAGARAGSVFGPWGAGVGGVLGALGGTYLANENAPNRPATAGSPNWKWLNPGNWFPGGPTTPATNGNADAVSREVHDFFRSKGLTEEQTAGILANVNAESSFNPQVRGGGLFQYTGDRYRQFTAMHGKAPEQASTSEQLEFAWWEMTQGRERAALEALRAARTPRQSGSAFSMGFERPANTEIEAARRGRSAEDFYERYKPQSALQASGDGRPALLPPRGTSAVPSPLIAPTPAAETPHAAQARNGNVHVEVRFVNPPRNTMSTVRTEGNVTASPLRIEQSLPLYGGP